MKNVFLKSLLTPFATGVPGGRLTTLLFHKIPKLVDPLTPDELDFVRFSKIIDILQGTVTFVRLDEAVRSLSNGSLPARAVALTFDDGYAEWFDTVVPFLTARGLPATFFISTEQLSGVALWHERIVGCVRALPERGAKLPFGFGSYSELNTVDRRAQLVAALQNRLKYLPLDERLATIVNLELQAEQPIELPRKFDANSVRELHLHGFDIGAHTIRHPILNECSLSEAREEIRGCKEQLEAITASKVKLFAYPNGRPDTDYASEHTQIVKECGYEAAVATCAGTADRTSDVFQLPRFAPWSPPGGLRFAYHLVQNYVTPSRRVATSPQGQHKSDTRVRCLLIASTFPPIHGGSAVVYESLCVNMPPGSIRVLTAKRNYLNDRIIDDWEKYDARSNFPIERIELLRPRMAPPPRNSLVSIYRLLFLDLPLYARALIAAAKIVKANNINVICVGELVMGSWLGLALRRLFGCKLIIYVHGEEITTATTDRLYGPNRKAYLAAADKVVAVSSFTCDALTKSMGLSAASIALIPNGVDVDKFRPGEVNEELFSRLGIFGKRVLLTVGRLVPRKGMDMSIAAMSHIAREVSDVHYLIVGKGEQQAELEALIQKNGLSDRVTLAGGLTDEEVVSCYRGCEVFLMPNRTMPDGDTEGFGLVFLEANACRKPVVGGNAGGAVEAIIHGRTGLLVDGSNPIEIADAVLSLLRDHELADRMAQTGFEIAQARSTKAVTKEFQKVCERLVRAYD